MISNEEIRDHAIKLLIERFVGEFNDDITRRAFTEAMYDFIPHDEQRFRVVCNAHNNTPVIIDTNSFVADIHVRRGYEYWTTIAVQASPSGISEMTTQWSSSWESI